MRLNDFTRSYEGNTEKVFITKEQLYDIKHIFVNMLEYQLDSLREICKDEKPDINIGFVLGTIHTDLSGYRSDLVDLLDQIQYQNANEPVKKKVKKNG